MKLFCVCMRFFPLLECYLSFVLHFFFNHTLCFFGDSKRCTHHHHHHHPSPSQLRDRHYCLSYYCSMFKLTYRTHLPDFCDARLFEEPRRGPLCFVTAVKKLFYFYLFIFSQKNYLGSYSTFFFFK